MAQNAKKTEHAGSKKGTGSYWGLKWAAKRESNRRRREIDKQLGRDAARGTRVGGTIE